MLVLHSLLLLLLVSLTTAYQCPDRGDLEPSCVCSRKNGHTKTLCSEIRHVEELRKVFSDTGDHPMVEFEVQKSVMSYFPASALKEKSVKELLFTETSLVGLFDRVPEQNNKLMVINLQKCNVLRGIEWSLLRNLTNLERFHTESVAIRSLDKEFMENMPAGIREIVLNNSGLSKINDRAFGRLTQLSSLGLIKGKITTLKRSMFPTENILGAIFFDDNQISELPDNIFSDMPNLQRLSLKNNLLTTMSETIFSKIERNVHLDLSGNNIHCDCKIRWTLKAGWRGLEANCHSPKHFEGKPLSGGWIADNEFEYCDDI